MAVSKLSVSVDAEIAEDVRAAARDEGVTVSAWLTAAAAARIRNRYLGEVVAETTADVPGFDAATVNDLTRRARATAIRVSQPESA